MRVGLNSWFMGQAHVGSGQYVHLLRREMARRRDIACLTFAPTVADVAVPLRPLGPLAKLWYEQVDMPRAVRSHVDIVHYPYFAAPLVKPCPVVVTILDLIPFLFPEYTTDVRVKLYNALIAQAARRADAIIAISEHTRRDVVTHLRIPAERVHVTYLALDGSFQPPDSGAVEAIRARYGLGSYVFYMGGLNRHKNVETLLRAFAAARPDLPPCSLVIGGKAHSGNAAVFPDLRAIAASLGLTWADGPQAQAADVRFIGYVPEDDKPALYGGAAAFVYPSLYEGFGLCPLEAMACGTPVICSNAASLPEVVGDGGLLVEPRDVQGIARAIVAVLSDQALAADLRARGLRQAARFSPQRVSEETIAVYRQALSGR